MSTFKKGQQVKARTVRGSEYKSGKVVGVNSTVKGDWVEVKTEDGTTFKTRPALVSAA